MKTLTHTEKEQIEQIIRMCKVCFVGMADTDGLSTCIQPKKDGAFRCWSGIRMFALPFVRMPNWFSKM